MKKSCTLDQTLQLPPIATRVLVDDDNEPGNPHPGIVCGYGHGTLAGSMVDPTTPLVPLVLVKLDRGVYLPGGQRCFISVIPVHPDNLTLEV